MGSYVGIDLGTTFSAVAYITPDGKPAAIPNEYNNQVTPSVVYLGPGGPLVGEEAKERQAMGDEEIAAFFKRYMGDPHFELTFQGKTYTPTDLSSLMLRYLKGVAEKHLDGEVTHAVVTVPAYFNNMQREATIEAGRKAGLEVLSIVNEPTAAAFAYGLRPTEGKQIILVYDLGGGTFDVSIVSITPEEQRVLGTGGDYQLGGKDWDDGIYDYLSSEFEDEFGVELDEDEFYALLVQAEQIKKSLSVREAVNARVQAQGYRGSYPLSREKFEMLTSDLMMRTQRLTEQVLEDIQLNWSDMDNVLLIGGSTRMPMVRNYVESMSGKRALTTINPDEAVALGAAIQAAFDVEDQLEEKSPLFQLAARKKSIDVMSHSLGMIAVNDDYSKYINSIIIEKNQPIPSEQTRPYKLSVGSINEAKLEVYMTQGEIEDPSGCAYLGKYVFSDFPKGIRNKAVLDVTYSYNQNGVVDVSAVERSTKKQLSLSIEPLPDDVPDRFMLPPERETVHEHLTVYLAFDLSGSMRGTPLKEAKKAAKAFMSQCDLSKTSIGLISVSDKTKVNLRANQSAKKISKGIASLSIGDTGYGNTGHPFDDIYSLLKNTKGIRYAIVLADGVWVHQNRAIKQAKRCHQEGIEIVAIGFGGADREFLKAISSSDEKSIFTDLSSLTQTFSTIAQELTEGRGKISLRK